MKMILWVEDQSDHICKVFDELSNDSIDEKLLDDYHIHRVDNLDDALTAVGNQKYDFYLLDIEFPDYDPDSDEHNNTQVITEFVENDPDEKTFNRRKAGIYLFMHLLPTIHISQVRIYSGHIDQIPALKYWAANSGLHIDWDDVIFNKSNDADKTAKEVNKWLKDIIKSAERILRHAMIDGCNSLLNSTQRTIYARNQLGNKPRKINQNKIINHIKLIRNIVSDAGESLAGFNAATYHSMLITIITANCQEYLSKDFKNRKLTIRLDSDFKKLSGVLDRIRNLLQHHRTINPSDITVQFLAFTFLVYARYISRFNNELHPFEKNVLKLFENANDENFLKSNNITKFMKSRTDVLKPPSRYDKMRESDKWSLQQNFNRQSEKKKEYSFQELFENRRFIKEEYQYGVMHCYQLFIVNFCDYKKRALVCPPKAMFNEDSKKWLVTEAKMHENDLATNIWSDQYIKAFCYLARPKG